MIDQHEPDRLTALMHPTTRRQLLTLAGLPLAALVLLPARAQSPPEATAATARPPETVLTITGKIRKFNQGAKLVFDRAALMALPQTTFKTQTPWYPQARTFTGPLLRDLLKACGAHGDTLRLLALNDFRMDMPLSDTQRFDVIAAHLLDGQTMSVREKGPLFVMYPFSSKAELRSMTYYARSVWQLHTIEVL